jgi:hypothetical protein
VASSGSRGVPGVGLTRRRFVKTVGAGVALGVAVPALLAPVSNAAPTLGASTSAAATPGTLVIGLVAEPTSLDPGQLTDINSMKLLGAMYDTLVRFKPNSFDLAPSLATSWDISGDLMLYTFKLRPGVKFHDGSDFNADAVKFTYDRLLDPNHPYADTGPFPFAPGYYGSIAETIVVDPLTVQFRLNRQDASLINAFTLNTGRIVSPTAVKAQRKNFSQNPVGTHHARGQSRLLGRRAGAVAAHLPTTGRRADAHHRVSVRWCGRHLRRPTRQHHPGQDHAVRGIPGAAGPARVVGHPEHQEAAVRQRAGPPRGQLRHQQGRIDDGHPEGHWYAIGRADPARHRLGVYRPGQPVPVRP